MSYVVFPHVEGHWTPEERDTQRQLARIMAASVRRVMPAVRVLMMTDHKTPAIEGIEPVRISTHGFPDWIPWVCNACSLMEGEVLYLDSDVVVQRDLRPLFNVDADAIFTQRGPKEFEGRLMPFLFGVVAYRSTEFWKEVRDRVLAMRDPKDLGWWGSQIIVFDMWMECQNGRKDWKIASIPCHTYNYTPKDAQDTPEDKFALHYKGKKRKAWM